MSLALLADVPAKFIDSFCDTRSVSEHFKNELGKFTPCFTDIVVLGAAHLTAVILSCCRIAQVRQQYGVPVYHLRRWSRILTGTAIAASGLALLVVLFQLNARIATDPLPLVSGNVAPFEWADYIITILTWVLFGAAFSLELNNYVPTKGWMLRFSVLFLFAGQLAKLRFVLILTEHPDYFFWLYIAYIALQGWLALLAILHFPRGSGLELKSAPDGFDYVALDTGDGVGSDKACPEDTANVFSLLSFSWIGPLIKAGYKSPLQFEDVWKLPPADSMTTLAAPFDRYWKEETKRRSGPSLTYAIWRFNKWLFITALPFKLTNDAAQFVGPLGISLLLGVVQKGQPSSLGYTYACLLLLGLWIGTLADNQHFQRVMRTGFRTRAVLVHQLFRKVISLSPSAWAQYSTGRVFNMVTSDVETLQLLSQNIMNLISSPLRIFVAMFLLYFQLGASSLVALASLILMMPIQAVLVRMNAKLTKKALQFTDERAKIEGELIGAMDVVKCSTWEDSFWEQIQRVRNRELKTLWHSFIVGAMNSFLFNFVPTLVSVLTFTTYVLLGNNLTASQAFTALSLFTTLRLPLFMLPQLVSQLVNARVAINRLQEFLGAEEQQPLPQKPPASQGETAISVKGEFTWEEGSPASLVDVDFQVQAGQLVAIVGSTGSGKSSLLGAALGLMQQVQGPTVDLRGKVAYVPQSAFIFGETVRNNILFGLPYDAARYQHAIDVASLGPDLESLQGGDQTELGERGVNVSGGQKQRISMARAVYSGADVFLFDDPLSALDAKVGRSVYNQCILGQLRDKTRLLVTNQLQYVSQADVCVFMAEGKLAEVGSYQQLMDKKGSFAQLMSQAEVEQEEKQKEGEGLVDKGSSKGKPKEDGQQQGDDKKEDRKGEAQPGGGRQGQLTDKEGRSKGAVSLYTLSVYVKAMGGWPRFLLLMTWLVGVEACRVATTVWLSHWTNIANRPQGAPHTALWYLAIYAAISGVQTLFQLSSTFLLKLLSIVAGRALHNNMLQRLLRAPMSFYHTTPEGRIINRLTKDTADVDKNLADFSGFFIRSCLQLASTIGIIGVVVPYALPALVPILLFFYFMYQYFQASVREVKRLDSISRSPVYTSIGEALNGLPTIRAFKAEQRLTAHNAALVDNSAVMSLVNQSMNRWLSVRLEGAGALAAFAAAILTVEQRGNASTFGLVLSYALQITMLTSMTVRLASVAENSFNAVERMDEFSNAKQEAAGNIDGSKPDDWPSAGKVEFKEVAMRYRPGLPLVLQDLNVSIAAGARCGVVGRTGAGKTSLIGCLFRLTELNSGKIVIDGVDIAKMGLTQLRSSLSIIPQVPVLFTGTMRSNLDPFEQYNDSEVWRALRRANLAGLVEGAPAGLDMQLSAGGAPLSAGQKQLVALARALLKRSKVLVLDEATANVDVETDALIQATVRKEFADCTLIAIAHRLHTVIDADAALVMAQGRAVEYGHPAKLLDNPDGVFSGMVAETGEGTAKFLRSVARGEGGSQKSDEDKRKEAMAARGLKRVATLPKHSTAIQHMSTELVDKAAAAATSLQACLDYLKDSADGVALRRGLDLDIDPALLTASNQELDEVTLHQAMAQALDFVTEVQSMAAQYRKQIDRRPPSRQSSSLSRRGSVAAARPDENTPPAAFSSRFSGAEARANGSASGSHAQRQSLDSTLPLIASASPRGGPVRSPWQNGSSGGNRSALTAAASLPLNTPIESSLEASRQMLAPGQEQNGPDSADAGKNEAKRRWARLRSMKRLLPSGAQGNFHRLRQEDPSLSGDPAFH